jgi:hypothetical protein
MLLRAKGTETRLEGRAQSDVGEIEQARREPRSDSIHPAVDDDGLSRPDRAIVQEQVELFEHAPWWKHEPERNLGAETRRTQIDDVERTDVHAGAPSPKGQFREFRRTESNRSKAD